MTERDEDPRTSRYWKCRLCRVELGFIDLRRAPNVCANCGGRYFEKVNRTAH